MFTRSNETVLLRLTSSRPDDRQRLLCRELFLRAVGDDPQAGDQPVSTDFSVRSRPRSRAETLAVQPDAIENTFAVGSRAASLDEDVADPDPRAFHRPRE